MTNAAPVERWTHRHLLDVADLAPTELEALLERAGEMRRLIDSGHEAPQVLRGQLVALVFVEPSTRTRLSFQVAAHRLGGDAMVLDAESSSLAKGESLPDTARTLDALGFRWLVMRHSADGAPWQLVEDFAGHVLNAGDGAHAHPSQALLDLFTLRRAFAGEGLEGRKIAIVGDILHSRVARSNVWTLSAYGVDLWLCGPSGLLDGFEAQARKLSPARRFNVTTDLDTALRDADAVMALRIQRERIEGTALPSLEEYVRDYGISEERLRIAKPGAFVLHPGPVNEGVELTPDVAHGPRSLILEQVRNGVPVRMAVFSLLAGTDAG